MSVFLFLRSLFNFISFLFRPRIFQVAIMAVNIIEKDLQYNIYGTPIKTKLSLNNQPIEQIHNFNYSGCGVSVDSSQDHQVWMQVFQHTCSIIWRTFKSKAWRETQMKFCWTMAMHVILYCSETWVMKKNRALIQACKMRFVRSKMDIKRVLMGLEILYLRRVWRCTPLTQLLRSTIIMGNCQPCLP